MSIVATTATTLGITGICNGHVQETGQEQDFAQSHLQPHYSALVSNSSLDGDSPAILVGRFISTHVQRQVKIQVLVSEGYSSSEQHVIFHTVLNGLQQKASVSALKSTFLRMS